MLKSQLKQLLIFNIIAVYVTGQINWSLQLWAWCKLLVLTYWIPPDCEYVHTHEMWSFIHKNVIKGVPALITHHILAEELLLPVISDVAGSESSSAASREAESNCSLRESSDSPSITDPLAWKPFISSLPSSGDVVSGGAGSAEASGWGLGFFFFLGWTWKYQCQIPLFSFSLFLISFLNQWLGLVGFILRWHSVHYSKLP